MQCVKANSGHMVGFNSAYLSSSRFNRKHVLLLYFSNELWSDDRFVHFRPSLHSSAFIKML